jgi:hypothetical protein
MNSCDGKTIERAIEKDYIFKQDGDEFDKFMIKNYNTIIEDIKLKDSSVHMIKRSKPIDNHFNFSLLGIHVLSMPKGIMNEVMCLAYDENCKIYYQDIDSMHIRCEDLPRLESAFKNKYDRDLIGSGMRQFHSDFEKINGHDEIPHSKESFFLMKKMYLDVLTDSSGDIAYHIRWKGITQNSIKQHGDPIKLYSELFNGAEKTFDLTYQQSQFENHKNMTISTKHQFTR